MGIESEKLYNLDNNEYKFKTNASGLVFNKMVFTDELGLRVPRENFKYNNNLDSIIFFGDSVTFGNGVEEEKTFVGLLRQNYKKFNFYNFSIPGYQIDTHTKNLKYIEKINNVKKIFYVFTLNDIDVTNNIEKNIVDNKIQKRDLNFIDKLRKNYFIRQVNYFLRNKSYLYVYLKGISTDPSSRWFKYDYNLYKNDKLLNNFDQFLDKFTMQTSKSKIEFSVLILPYEFQTRKENCNYEFLLPQDKIMKILQKKNIKFYDLTIQFCSKSKAKNLFYKFDPMHLSKKGHLLVYDFLNENIFN